MKFQPKYKEELIRKFFRSQGIEELYPPQEMSIGHILEGRNLVVSAPTASGKTLIAYIGILNTLLEGGKAIYIVPLKALAAEKNHEIRELLEAFRSYVSENGIDVAIPHPRVAVSVGDYDTSEDRLGSYDVIIATSEKVDSIMRHDPPWIYLTTLVIADEVHIINDRKRGPTMEMIITRFRMEVPSARIIALSATIENATELGIWLNSAIVRTDWRPVDLRLAVAGDMMIKFTGGRLRPLDDAKGIPQPRNAAKRTIASIVGESLENGYQVLVFSSTRKGAEVLSRDLSPLTEKYLSPGDLKVLTRFIREISSTSDDIDSEDYDKKVIFGLNHGCAFHHAGLSSTHRSAIEESFKSGALKCIVATPTLAAGVNLPSRRVIVSDYKRFESGLGKVPISVMEMQQMLGRAGRPRYDPYGEGIIIAVTPSEMSSLEGKYLLADTEPIKSGLINEDILRIHLLASISYKKMGMTMEDIRTLMEATFMAVTTEFYQIENRVLEQLGFLISEGMVEVDGGVFRATALGRRVSQLYVDPASAAKFMVAGRIIRRELDMGDAGGEVLQGDDLTDLLLFTALNAIEINTLYIKAREKDELNVMALSMHPAVHKVAEAFRKQIHRWSSIKQYSLDNIPPISSWTDKLSLKGKPVVYDEFLSYMKTMKMITLWINEVSSGSICSTMDIGPGDLKYQLDNVKWMLYSMAELYSLGGMPVIAKAVDGLAKRVEHGVKEEALEIVSLKGIGRVRGRTLIRNGFRSLSDLKHADVDAIAKLPGFGMKLARSIKQSLEGKSIESDGYDNSGEGDGPTENEEQLEFTTADTLRDSGQYSLEHFDKG